MLNRSVFFAVVSGLICLELAAETLPYRTVLPQQDLKQQYEAKMQPEQMLMLEAADEKFLGIYRPQEAGTPQGGILLLHDAGTGADWPYLLKQLRQYLPKTGWSTLAIDLPSPWQPLTDQLSSDEQVNHRAQSQDQWQARIEARIAEGINHLNNEGMFNIAVIGIGDGGFWAADFLARRLNALEEDGYALILIEAPLNYPELPSLIAQLNIPVLDLFMNDSELSHAQAELRKIAAAQAQHPNYLQINDAPRHGFYGIPKIDRTTRRVWGWLKRNAAGYEAVLNR